MPRLILTEQARCGLQRCRCFLKSRSPAAARHAAQRIVQAFERLQQFPQIGRPDAEHPALRELVIPFGDSGYVALYRYVPEEDCVYILAFRHAREAGYDTGKD